MRAKRTTVLLGAGASVDGGIPASKAMTAKIGEALLLNSSNSYTGVMHAFNYAVGALIGHRSASGSDPFAGIDIEELFAAVQSLGDRDHVDVAPFVSWSPALASIGREPRTPTGWDSQFTRILQRMSNKNGYYGDHMADLIADLARDVGQPVDSQRAFKSLENQMLIALTTLLKATPAKFKYLRPIFNLHDKPLNVVTLNYDRSVEVVAKSMGKVVDTGITAWKGAHDWTWSREADVRLLKLHGSIDWVLTEESGPTGLPQVGVRLGTPSDRGWQVTTPAVVFGARGKLRPDGPFLAMLREFDTIMTKTDRLVVVGYSFRDDHINVVISRWLNGRPDRELVVLDYGYEQARLQRQSYIWRLSGIASRPRDQPNPLKARFVAKKAKDGLEEALSL